MVDPPVILWTLSNRDFLNCPTIAIVGMRNASSRRIRAARRLAADLSPAGFSIVSGLARGVDIAVLETGTIAAMVGGVDVVYPKDARHQFTKRPTRGVSHAAAPHCFRPFAQAVIVIETAAKFGSLITARTALDQGRDVLTVRGHPFDARASGCNMAIRDGAALERSAKDIIEALERPEPARQPRLRLQEQPDRTKPATHGLHQQILDRLGPSPALKIK